MTARAIRSEILIAPAVFLLTAIVFTWPLAGNLASAIPTGPGPPTVALFGLFTMEWTAASLEEGRPYWDPPGFHPQRGTFAWSEPQPLTALAVWGLSKVAGLLAAYNLILIIYAAAAGSAGYALARLLTEDRVASLWAGIWFTAGAYPIQQIGVLHLLAGGFPVACIAAVLYLARTHLTAAAWCAGSAYLLTWLTCAQYGLFLTVLLPFAIAPLLLGRERRHKEAAHLFAALAVGLALASPFLLAQHARLAGMGLERTLINVRGSYVPADLVLPADGHWLTTGLMGFSGATGAYPHDVGVVPLACLAAACLAGTFRLRALDAARRRTAAAVLSMSAAALLLGFGPGLGLQIGGRTIGPYAWLHALVPGFGGVRTPSRFALFVATGVAVLGAAALASLRAKMPGPATRRALTIVLYVLLLAEMWAIPLGLADPDEGIGDHAKVLAWLKDRAAGEALLEIPTPSGDSEADLASDVMAMRRAIRHASPIVNGYSGYVAETYRQVRWAMELDPQGRGGRYLNALGVRYVLAHDHDLVAAGTTGAAALPGGEIVYRDGRDTIVRFAGDRASSSTPPASAPPFPTKPRPGDVLRVPIELLTDRARLFACGDNQILRVAWEGGGAPPGGKTIRLRGSVLVDAGGAWLHMELLRFPSGSGPGEAVLLSEERLARSPRKVRAERGSDFR